MIIIDEIWRKMVENVQKWSKMAKNGQKWSKMVKNDQKCSMVIIDILLRTNRFIIQTTRFGGRTGSFEKLGTE